MDPTIVQASFMFHHAQKEMIGSSGSTTTRFMRCGDVGRTDSRLGWISGLSVRASALFCLVPKPHFCLSPRILTCWRDQRRIREDEGAKRGIPEGVGLPSDRTLTIHLQPWPFNIGATSEPYGLASLWRLCLAPGITLPRRLVELVALLSSSPHRLIAS